MGIYLAKGGESNTLLGLTCRHVLIGPNVPNLDYAHIKVRRVGGSSCLARKPHTKLADSIKIEIGQHGLAIERWRGQIEGFKGGEKGTYAGDIEKARKDRDKTQALLDDVEEAMGVLGKFLGQVQKDWSKLDNRVLGTVLCSPAVNLGVGEHRFTEDWGIFQVDRTKLGDGFHGNKIDLGAF